MSKNGGHENTGIYVLRIWRVKIPSYFIRSSSTSLGPRSQIVAIHAAYQQVFWVSTHVGDLRWCSNARLIRNANGRRVEYSCQCSGSRDVYYIRPTLLITGRADFGRHVRAPETQHPPLPPQIRRRTCALLVDRQSF